jgi:hypothetical protein
MTHTAHPRGSGIFILHNAMFRRSSWFLSVLELSRNLNGPFRRYSWSSASLTVWHDCVCAADDTIPLWFNLKKKKTTAISDLSCVPLSGVQEFIYSKQNNKILLHMRDTADRYWKILKCKRGLNNVRTDLLCLNVNSYLLYISGRYRSSYFYFIKRHVSETGFVF